MRLETRNGTFEALVAGAAESPIVLCLHGFPDTPRGFLPLLERLAAAGYRAIAPYMRGYQPSTLSGPLELSRVADDIVALADSLSPDCAVRVVGHDWGAVATYTALIRAPKRFDRAVTLSVPHPGSWLASLPRCPRQLWLWWYVAFFNLGQWAWRRAAAADYRLVERLWRTWSPGFEPTPAYFQELKRCLAASGSMPFQYYRALLRSGSPLFARRPVPIDTPTLYLHGQDDGCIDVRMIARQERYFRAAFEAKVIPNAGHFLQLECPELVADHISRWFARAAPDGR